jgi:hypothetical protein
MVFDRRSAAMVRTALRRMFNGEAVFTNAQWEVILKHERHSTRRSELAAGLVLGALAMYLLDPDRGRRRRAIVRDKARRAYGDALAFGCAAIRDARHRIEGLAARTRRLMAANKTDDELRLIERVRARMGRAVGNPHAIHVGALGGRVVLSGPVLASEAPRLLATVRAVPGVLDVDEHLVLHDTPASVPSLQGAPLRSQLRAARGARRSPAQRGAAALGAGVLLTRGLARGGVAGVACVALGLALALRAGSDGAPGREGANAPTLPPT